MLSPYEVTTNNNSTILTVRGSLDINTAPALAEEIDKIIQTKPTKVAVDLSPLELIDSSGVAALVKLYKGIRSSGGDIGFTGAKDQPLAIFKLLRMDRVFDL
jgi:anti-sigma B factor antagonist